MLSVIECHTTHRVHVLRREHGKELLLVVNWNSRSLVSDLEN